MKQIDKFLILISKLDVIQFTALARILKVQLVQEIESEGKKDYITRPFSEVIGDVLQNYESSSRARRREILQLLSAAVRAGDDDNADNT